MTGGRCAIAIAIVIALSTSARAHQASITHSRATVDAAAVDYQIHIAATDLGEAAGRDAAAVIDLTALDAATWAKIAAYVTARIAIASEAGPCPYRDARAGADGDRAVVQWRATCARPIATLAITYDLFFDLDPAHDAALRVLAPDHDPVDTVLVADANRFAWELRESPPSSALAFIRAGVHHVATGLDHVAFVLTLLIGVVIVRAGGGWERRAVVPALRSTAMVVSAFTVAHSLTLIAAALGWVAVPALLVEATIAGSIVVTAVAAAWRPERRGSWLLAFGFGLVHGLGFARMLTPLLPAGDVVVPLLCFNLGVELAQLAVVVVALPAAALVAWGLGAVRYRRVALPIAAAILALLGLLWLIERVGGVRLLGW